MSQTILFVCATGIATSTAVTEKVMEYCKEHGLNVNYSQTNVASLPGNTDGVALLFQRLKCLMNSTCRWLTACQLLLVLAKRKYWRKLFLS